MGSGKSTLAKNFSSLFSYEWCDMDDIIEKNYGLTIPNIFLQKGEEFFRELETETLKSFNPNQKMIIGTGGGTPCFNNNMKLINSIGTSVYIKVSPFELTQRLFPNKSNRPLISKFENKVDLEAYIKKTLAQREEFYNLSNYVYESDNANAEGILKLVSKGDL
jgi:shikimate kinase